MRALHALSYLGYLLVEIVRGSAQVVRSTLTPGPVAPAPSVVELPLACRSDLEITAMTSSITITPGTLVLGVAAAEGDLPPTVFVHSLDGRDREEVVAGLREMERRLLRATRRALPAEATR